MRVVVCLATISLAGLLVSLLAGCSVLLGIENPRAGDAGTGDDGDIGADHLTFSLGDFQVAQGQTVRLHVLATFADASVQDVTPSATYTSDNPAAATFGGPGLVNSGAQPGTATITARLGSATPATVKVTVTTAPCHPVINELTVGRMSLPADEWVEIYNPCTNAIDVTNWTLVYRGPNVTTGDDSRLMVTLIGSMASGAIRLYAGNEYAGMSDGIWPDPTGIIGQTDGAVGLRRGPMNTGPLADSIAYGAVLLNHPFTENNPAPEIVNGRNASRLPFDGKDDNDGAADFVILTMPTPRALNVP